MKKSNIILFGLITFTLFSLTFVSAYDVVSGTYSKSFTVDATAYSFKSCNIQSNYESGRCQYLYACYVITPYPSTSFNQAVQKECIDITDTKKSTFQVTYTPFKGQGQLAVTTFVTVLDYTYNPTTFTWANVLTIPTDYRSAAQIVSLCGEGKMLKGNLCYNAKAYCANTQSTNLCTNPYPLYLLDFGTGFDASNTASYCADRQNRQICDDTVSVTCTDTCKKYNSIGACTIQGADGICDVDEQMLAGATCADTNHNYVCDDVETQGTFCRTNFEPVFCGTGTACVTYPNSCFASAAGCTTSTTGTCKAIYADYCAVDANCPSPCNGVSGQCLNKLNTGFTCYYSGTCNAQMIQCAKDADCPAPYCKGVAAVCSSNTCSYSGRCITQPAAPASFWDKLASAWNDFLTWLNNIFGGGTTLPPATILNSCYQETATTATTCGGLASGSYSCSGGFFPTTPCTNGYDGSWSTQLAGNLTSIAILYVNYTVPSDALSSSLWTVKSGQQASPYWQTVNYTIPSACWGSQLAFRVRSNNTQSPYGVDLSCYTNAHSWQIISYQPAQPPMWEEAMVWSK